MVWVTPPTREKSRSWGDTVTGLGDVPEQGIREIDAAGSTVTPGFVDLHTHLDAQVGWDPMMTPASSHGVTTALMGNCGVTIAPVRNEHREVLASMMESVEGPYPVSPSCRACPGTGTPMVSIWTP